MPTNPQVQTTSPVPSASKENVRGASSSATTNAEWTIARHRRSKTAQEKTAPMTTPATHQSMTYAQAAHPATVVGQSSLPPCSGSGEPCPSTPLCAPPPASSHSGILTRGQPTIEAIGLAGQDLFGEGSDRGSYRSTLHRCQYPLPHAVRDLPFGGPTRCNGRDTTSSRTSSYHEESGHLRPIGSATCPCHNPAITPDLSSAIDLRQPPTLLLPRFLTPDLHHSPALVRSATAPPTTSTSASKQRSRAFPRNYNTNSCSRP